MPAFHQELIYRAKLALKGRVFAKPQPKPLLFSGPGSSRSLCRTIAEFGLRNILVVTDKPLVELGIPSSTIEALNALGVATTVYDGVEPDPTKQVVDAGIALLKQSGCDSVLAFGGGSSIDAAKVIALGAANNCTAEECMGFKQCDTPSLPFFAIPTTAGTGSEGTFIAVISDNETHAKGGVVDPCLIPRAAALDPELMTGLPPHITAATGMDALTHAIESYIGNWGTPETRFYGLAAINLIFNHLAEACKNGNNLEAREAMAQASYYGGLAITNAMVGYVHAVSHNLGGKYGLPHGLGNAIVLPHVMTLMKEAACTPLSEIAVHVGLGAKGEPQAALAQKLIDRVVALNEEIGIPTTTDVIKSEDIEELADVMLAEGSGYPTPRFLERDECVNLLKSIQAA